METNVFSAKKFFARALGECADCVLKGFFCIMLLLGALVHWASLGSVVEGNILGFGFQLSAVLFFGLVGLCRSLKVIPGLNATFYRLFHFLLSGVFLYVCFFALWPNLSVSLSEQKADTLASGSVNWASVILAYVFFGIAYFAVIGIRAGFRARRARKMREAAAYESMLEKKRRKKDA